MITNDWRYYIRTTDVSILKIFEQYLDYLSSIWFSVKNDNVMALSPLKDWYEYTTEFLIDNKKITVSYFGQYDNNHYDFWERMKLQLSDLEQKFNHLNKYKLWNSETTTT